MSKKSSIFCGLRANISHMCGRKGQRRNTMARAIHIPQDFKDIWKLAWPQMLMMIAHFFIGFTDVWTAGRISSDVQSCLGMVNRLMFMFLVVAVAVANGSVAAISQSMGAGLYKRILRYVGLCLEIAVGLGVLILITGSALNGYLLDALNVPEQLDDIMRYFLDVILILLPFYYILIITNAIFRAQKRVFVPLFSMTFVCIVNVVGDLGFGLGWFGLPAYGYKALPWSTFTSIVAGMCFNLLVLRRLRLLQVDSFPPLRWIKRGWYYLFKVAWPGGLMQLVWHSGYLALYAVVAALPHDNIVALAGISAGLQVESFLFLPGFAFNMTATILVGEYLGKRRPDLAKRVTYQVWGVGVLVFSAMAAIMWIWIEPIAAFIAPDPKVAAEVVDYLFWNVLAIPGTMTTMIISGAMAGAGATLYNLIISGRAHGCFGYHLHTFWAITCSRMQAASGWQWPFPFMFKGLSYCTSSSSRTGAGSA